MCIRDRYTPRTGAQGVWAPDFFSLYLRVRNPRLEQPGARHPSTLTLRLLRSMRLDERRPGRPLGRWYNPTSGPLAQLVEQGTFNPKVTGSIPVRPTTRSPQTGSADAEILADYRRRGTLRLGDARRVSPLGLASCRSRSVKTSISSRASKARLRRPTVTCVSTSASLRRAIASFVARR